MDMLKKAVAVFLVGISMVTAAHFILSPLYPDSWAPASYGTS